MLHFPLFGRIFLPFFYENIALAPLFLGPFSPLMPVVVRLDLHGSGFSLNVTFFLPLIYLILVAPSILAYFVGKLYGVRHDLVTIYSFPRSICCPSKVVASRSLSLLLSSSESHLLPSVYDASCASDLSRPLAGMIPLWYAQWYV